MMRAPTAVAIASAVGVHDAHSTFTTSRPVPVTDSFQTLVLDQLSRVVPRVRARRMFGGVGLYQGELFFALIADDAVYFKADASTRPEFEARGMGPFRPFGDDRGTMQYYQVPEDLLENPEALRPWAEKAIAIARRKKTRPPR
jgi:DNA transformation protein